MVNNGPYIDIVPVDPNFYYVPYYDPAIVFFPPRPGFRVGLGIHFGPGIGLGAAFAPWGWYGGGIRFSWGEHAFFLNNRPWVGVRPGYVHPYNMPRYDRGGFDRREMHERREGGGTAVAARNKSAGAGGYVYQTGGWRAFRSGLLRIGVIFG